MKLLRLLLSLLLCVHCYSWNEDRSQQDRHRRNNNADADDKTATTVVATESEKAWSRHMMTSACSGTQVELSYQESASLLKQDSSTILDYILTCDDRQYWDVSQEYRRPTTERLCLSPMATCHFQMYNSDDAPEWQLTVDGSVVVDSNASDETVQVCFGRRCDDAFVVTPFSQSACAKEVTLTLLIDLYPKEISYRLTCDDVELWDVSPGTYETSFDMIEKTDCLPPNFSYCEFVIFDTYGDGLIEEEPGFFALTVDAETVAVYDGSEKYQVQSFCFGPKCQENHGCDPIEFLMTTDEFPNEVGFTLECNGQYEWNKPQNTFHVEYETIFEQACVDLENSCCTLTVLDSEDYADGLISPTRNLPGAFELVVADERKAFYDGSDGLGYAKLMYQFGNRC